MRPVDKSPAPPDYGGDYGVMRQRLLERIGSYCSYCEAPLTNDAAVEHKVAKEPKHGFPALATSWVNLLLACWACNSAKSSHPNTTDAHGLMAPDFEDVMALWVWPDGHVAPAGGAAALTDRTLDLFKYELGVRTQKDLISSGWARLRSGLAVKDPWYDTAANCVWVIPNTAWINTQPGAAALKARVAAVLAGLNLNYHNPWDPKYGDRRVANRTYAWTVANRCAVDLGNLWATFPPGMTEAERLAAPHLSLLVRSIRATALAVGYWSVWFTVLRSALLQTGAPPWQGVTPAARQRLLRWILVEYRDIPMQAPERRNGNASRIIFPGTDLTRVDTTLV